MIRPGGRGHGSIHGMAVLMAGTAIAMMDHGAHGVAAGIAGMARQISSRRISRQTQKKTIGKAPPLLGTRIVAMAGEPEADPEGVIHL